MVVQAMPVVIQQTKFRPDTGCVGGNVVQDKALLRDVDAANVSVTGVAGPADQTSLKATLLRHLLVLPVLWAEPEECQGLPVAGQPEERR